MTQEARPGRAASVPRVAGYTLRRQWPAEIFTGLVAGIASLAGFVAKRSLGAPDWVVPLIVVAGQAAWVFAPGWEAVVARLDPRRAFLWMGAVANVPLLFVALVPTVPEGSAPALTAGLGVFLGAIVMLSAVDAVYLPLRNALVRANYAEGMRGRLFGVLSTVAKLSSVGSASAAGFLLHADPRWLRVAFPLAGLFGMTEHVLFSRIRWHREGRLAVRTTRGARAAWRAFREAWRNAARILREDRAFRTFEVGFMVYGMGLLASQPMIVIYTESDLRLDYSHYTLALGVVEPLVHVVALSVLGRLMDRLGVVRTTALAFLLLTAYFALLLTVSGPVGFIAISGLLGLTMAAVNLGWNLGPLRFAPPGQARAYASVHMSFVGVRSVLAPALGFAVYRLGSPRLVFTLSLGCALVAALVMLRLRRSTR